MKLSVLMSLATATLAQSQDSNFAADASSAILEYAAGLESEGIKPAAATYLAGEIVTQTSGPIADAFSFFETATYGDLESSHASTVTAVSAVLGFVASAVHDLPSSDQPAFNSLLDEAASLQGISAPAVAAAATTGSVAAGQSTASAPTQSSGSAPASTGASTMAVTTSTSASQSAVSSASAAQTSTKSSGAGLSVELNSWFGAAAIIMPVLFGI